MAVLIKLFVFIIVPVAIIYVFWTKYTEYNRKRPEKGSFEEKQIKEIFKN